MSLNKNWGWIVLLLVMPSWISAQMTNVYSESLVHYKRGMDFFDKEVYGLAEEEFQKASNRLITTTDHETEVLKVQIALMSAISALRLEKPEAEVKLADFVKDYRPNPLINKALYELGNYHYANRRYDEAAEYFSQIERGGLTEDQYAEVRFKTGYGYFIKKKFSNAKTVFSSIRNVKNIYYYPANYYYGMSSYYLNNYRDAVDGFKAASGSRRYKVQVPYYIVSISFSQKEYDEVIRYGEEVLKESDVQKKTEIGQMVGQAYFEKGMFTKALPYLNEYADRTRNLSAEEYYQVGYVNYMTKNWDKAIQYLREASSENSEIGQLGSYYLADSYLNKGDKPGARTAFAKAAGMKFRSDIAEDALFQFAKLSAELNADREAIQALLLFKTDSPYYSQAQDVISDILYNTSDFENAIKILEDLGSMTPKMKEAYQKVTFNQGLKEFNNRNYDKAMGLFDKSLLYPVDARLKTMSTFWKAEILHQQKDFAGSTREMNNFFSLERAISNLPDKQMIHLANYTQGYNYIKQDNYVTALGFFEKAIDGIKRNIQNLDDDLVKRNILGDAVLRAGDCHFKRNRYTDAAKFYNEAIDNKYVGFDYAMFQKAMIAGLNRNINQKISLMEDLVRVQPNSSYADDALYELGFAYEETGNISKAKESLSKLVNNYKGKSQLINVAYIKLGLITYNSGNKREALTYYKEVFKNNPSKQEGDDAMAAIEEIYVADLGDTNGYFKFRESIPGYVSTGDTRDSLTYRVALLQYENGNYERAIAGYTDYLQKYPNGTYALDAFYNRGESYLILKQYGNALKDYDAVISRGQSRLYIRALEKAAVISYNDAADFVKAYTYYVKLEEATNNENTRFEAQLGAMRSAIRSDNLTNASTYAQKLIDNPRASTENKATAHFILGKVRYQRKEYNQAISSFNSAIRLVKDNTNAAEARYLIAQIHFDQKEYQVAEEKAREVLSESAAYALWVAKSLILLSDIYVATGDLVNARAALEVVIENFDEDPALVKQAQDKLKEVERRQQSSQPRQRKSDDEIDFNEFNRNK